MFHQTVPLCPTPIAEAASRPDRTRILDPKQFWPDPMACPDWPHLGPHRLYDGPIGKAGAEQRLERIGSYLNRAAISLHVPTDDERTDEFARTFKRTGNFSNWYDLGIVNLSPLGRLAEDDAGMMVEACHLRGYLAKLEAQVVRVAEAAEERRKSEARRALENYRRDVPAEIEEIEALADAVERHKQRLEDERAFARARMLREHVETLHGSAVQAAHTLGLGVPDAPAVLG